MCVNNIQVAIRKVEIEGIILKQYQRKGEQRQFDQFKNETMK